MPHWEGYTSRDAVAAGGLRTKSQFADLDMRMGHCANGCIFRIDVYGSGHMALFLSWYTTLRPFVACFQSTHSTFVYLAWSLELTS